MILYHGSNIMIENIDLNKCIPYKDFGKIPWVMLNTYNNLISLNYKKQAYCTY
ncbi:DUF3990 domain-containing protein [Clostridium sp. FP1]|uniref:DUF3990 domain-containing protein n=1 Tax=Clostridium sp. FP1 TaxID=2724076 RepID=UPI0013E995EB|nr:DUF3990 domain-containing protein [Clostridium sp. FP1]MBZ9634692.1 DUF3990 domain-containing protein [Clostridium sp. FP1]